MIGSAGWSFLGSTLAGFLLALNTKSKASRAVSDVCAGISAAAIASYSVSSTIGSASLMIQLSRASSSLINSYMTLLPVVVLPCNAMKKF